MLKKEITYTDFNDNKVTEPFYFNLTEPELIDLDVDVEGGLSTFLRRIIETTDQKALIEIFKKIVIISYGKKSDDGKHFFKSQEERDLFIQHAAYPVLYMELATETDAAVKFLTGVLPREMRKDIEKAAKTVENGTLPDPTDS